METTTTPTETTHDDRANIRTLLYQMARERYRLEPRTYPSEEMAVAAVLREAGLEYKTWMAYTRTGALDLLPERQWHLLAKRVNYPIKRRGR